MKRILLITAISFGLTSCFKSDNRDLGVYNTSDGYMKYQLNNYPYEINGGYSAFSNTGIGVYGRKQIKSSSVPATRYVIVGQLTTRKTINIVILTDSLKTGSYTSGSASNAATFAKIDSIQYTVNQPTDILNINITKNASGTIEGSFSGKLSSATTVNGTTTYTDAIITNGEFKNVAIGY